MVVLVEGESDCHTLWFHGFRRSAFPAPPIGAKSVTRGISAGHRDDLRRVSSRIVVGSGQGVAIAVVDPPPSEDAAPAGQGPLCAPSPGAGGFQDAWTAVLLGAVPWTAVEAETQQQLQNRNDAR